MPTPPSDRLAPPGLPQALAATPGADLPVQWTTIAAPQPGPRLLVMGGVHGDEGCGTAGILRALQALASGSLRIARGQVSFVPVANPLARQRRHRDGSRNLNRSFGPSPAPASYEDAVANRLCPLLAQHDVLLDLHSFHTPGEAFAMTGPPDNTGALEPFARAAEEAAFARHLGVPRVVEGWLDVYAAGAQARHARALAAGEPGLDIAQAIAYGRGTNEYMRSVGGYAVTLECGQHDDPQALDVAWQAICHALAFLGLSDAPAPAATGNAAQAMELAGVVDRLSEEDRFVRDWTNFDPVEAGTLIGVRADGQEERAPYAGFMVFPHPTARPGTEWFYLARRSQRAAASA